MHAASDQTADVHCLELRTGDFVQFVPPNANAAALDFAKVSTPYLEFRMPQWCHACAPGGYSERCSCVAQLVCCSGLLRPGRATACREGERDVQTPSVLVEQQQERLSPVLPPTGRSPLRGICLSRGAHAAPRCPQAPSMLSRASSLPPLRIIAGRKIPGQV